jgi:molybdopterin synthase catalytic subunit
MRIEIRERPFEPYAELRRYQESFDKEGKFGATVSFVGTMRDINEDAPVEAMTLEHYAGMTEKHLLRIGEEASKRWKLADVLMMHRVGALKPGDPIVLVAVWAAHRGMAFEACRFLIEELKSRAPFWKKETNGMAARWVERNTSGY